MVSNIEQVEQGYREPEVRQVEPGTRVPFTKLLKKEDIKQSIEESAQSKNMSFQDVVNGLVGGSLLSYGKLKGRPKYEVNGTEAFLTADQILSAKHTDEDQTLFNVAQAINNEYNSVRFGGTAPVIGGVQYGTNQITAEKGTREYTFARDRLNVANTLTGMGITDPLMQEIMVDKFHTGNFYRELYERGFKETGRTPYYLSLLGNMFGGFLNDEVKSTITGQDPRVYAQEGVSTFESRANNIREFFEATPVLSLLPDSKETILNELMHKSLKTYLANKHGAEKGMEIYNSPQSMGGYTYTDPETNEKKPIQIFNMENADTLFNYSFYELPKHERFGIIGVENLSLAVGGASVSRYLALRAAKQVTDARTKNPTKYHLGMTDKQVHKALSLENNDNVFSKLLTHVRFFPGQVFRTEGKAAKGLNELNAINALETINNDIVNIDNKISRLMARKNFNPTSPNYVKLVGEKKNLVARATRMSFLSKKIVASPMLVGTAKDELVISLGQMAGGTLFSNMGYSPEAGEALGAITTAFKLHKLVTYPTKRYLLNPVDNYFFKGAVKDFPRQIGRFIEDTGGIFGVVPEGFFVDRTLDQVDTYLKTLPERAGKGLTTQERASFTLLSQLTSGLDPKEKLKVEKALRETFEVREKIVSAFPSDQQDEMRQLYQQSFADTAGLVPLQAIEKMFSGKMRFKDLMNFDFTEIGSTIERQETLLNQSMVAVKEMRRRAETTGISPADKNFLKSWNENTEKRLLGMRESLNERQTLYTAAIRSYRRHLMSTPGSMVNQSIDKGILDDLFDLEVKFAKVYNLPTVESLAKQKEILDDMTATMYGDLNEAFVALEQFKGTPQGQLQNAQLMERLFDLRLFEIRKKGKLAYEPFRQSGAAQVDVSNTISNFLDRIEEFENRPLHQVFSKEGRFFGGSSGKLLKKTFNKLISKSLDDLATNVIQSTGSNKSPDMVLDELKSMIEFKQGFYPNNEELFMILRKPPEGFPIPDGMELSAANISIDADYFDLEEMQRHFRDLSVRSGDTEQASTLKNFSDELLDILKTDEKRFPLLKEARQKYQQVVFDKTRPKGYAANILSNQKGPKTKQPVRTRKAIQQEEPAEEILMTDYSKFGREYSPGNEPVFWHTKLTDSFDKYTNSGKNQDFFQAQTAFEDMTLFWTDVVTNNAGRDIMAFDLTTEFGKTKFNAFSNAIRNNLYENWAALRKQVIRNVPDPVERINFAGNAGLDGLRPLDEDFINSMDNLQSLLTVKVKQADGSIIDRKLVNLEDMVMQERDITKVLASDPKARKIYTDIVNDFNDVNANLTNKLNQKVKADDEARNVLMQELKISDASEFFEKFIINGNPEDIDLLKDVLTKKRITKIGRRKSQLATDAKPLKVSNEFNKDELDSVIANLVQEGLFAYGGHTTLKNTKMTRFDGSTGLASGFTGEGIAKISGLFDTSDVAENSIQAKRVMENLNAALGEENADVTRSMFKFFEQSQAGAGLDEVQFQGLIRDISPNELISRGFNLARGMVSPAYVAAELYVRLAGSNGIDLMKMAVTDPVAGKLMQELVTNPTTMDVKKSTSFVNILKEFVFTELVRMEIDDLPEELDMDLLQSAYYNQPVLPSEKEN